MIVSPRNGHIFAYLKMAKFTDWQCQFGIGFIYGILEDVTISRVIKMIKIVWSVDDMLRREGGKFVCIFYSLDKNDSNQSSNNSDANISTAHRWASISFWFTGTMSKSIESENWQRQINQMKNELFLATIFYVFSGFTTWHLHLHTYLAVDAAVALCWSS